MGEGVLNPTNQGKYLILPAGFGAIARNAPPAFQGFARSPVLLETGLQRFRIISLEVGNGIYLIALVTLASVYFKVGRICIWPVSCFTSTWPSDTDCVVFRYPPSLVTSCKLLGQSFIENQIIMLHIHRQPHILKSHAASDLSIRSHSSPELHMQAKNSLSGCNLTSLIIQQPGLSRPFHEGLNTEQ
jgi:hypothetical protein